MHPRHTYAHHAAAVPTDHQQRHLAGCHPLVQQGVRQHVVNQVRDGLFGGGG
jgi:hypothetical protein